MQKQSPFKKYAALIALGFMGGTIYTPQYIGSTFYNQVLSELSMTNTEFGLISSFTGIAYIVTALPGAYLSDKLEAKSVIIFSCGGVSVLSLLYPLFVRNMLTYCLFQTAIILVMIAYWSCLIKYINNLSGEDGAGGSFGTYYMINGMSGAIGVAIPLWVTTQFGGGKVSYAVFTMGVITFIATVGIAFFLESEKKLAERGIYLKGDEPIQIKHIGYLVKWPGTYMLMAALFATGNLHSFMRYFTPYLTVVFDIDPTVSSALAIVRQYVTLIITPVGGYLVDKVFKATYKWYFVAFAGIGTIYLSLVLFVKPTANPIVMGVISVLICFACMSLYGVSYSILRELHIPNMVSGTAIGIATMSISIVGLFISPMFGHFIDANPGITGFNYIFICIVINCLIGLLDSIWVASHHKKCLEGKRKMNLGKLAE